MRSEPFWNLIANSGCEIWIESKSSMRSFANLNTAVRFALIDEDLTAILSTKEGCDLLKEVLINTYFPYSRNLLLTQKDSLPSSNIICEDTATYKRRLEELRKTISSEAYQEEVFVRSGIFKREIPKIYNNTCAVSDMRVDSMSNISMVDACHIVPFSEGNDDTLINGIALCPNLHKAFDRGLISISDEYRVNGQIRAM